MSTNNSDIAERIAAARHEAESLKEKIKQKKDALADTTREFFSFVYSLIFSTQFLGASVIVGIFAVITLIS
jgi:hypothetical protein